jgi:4-aminobutyrate aminotransferase-like enzyme
MMFPCALTLFSEAVHTKIAERGARLLEIIWSKYGYDWGLKTALNVLRLAERLEMPARVARTAAVFSKLLNGEQALSRNVREVRVFGLLIGVELDTTRGPRRWLRKRLATIYLLAMLRHQGFPVLAGLCQYEPNVIKITPALNASDDEVRRACATIIDVLNRPLYKVLAGALKGLFRPALRGNRDHEHGIHPALEPVAR